MKIDKKGCTRIVILTKNYAIKIANFTTCHLHFLQGCYSNWSERHYNKIMKNMPEFLELVAPSLFCSWFGLIQIQRRCSPKPEELTTEEIDKYKDLHKGDFKKENFGYYNNKLVCLDYP